MGPWCIFMNCLICISKEFTEQGRKGGKCMSQGEAGIWNVLPSYKKAGLPGLPAQRTTSQPPSCVSCLLPLLPTPEQPTAKTWRSVPQVVSFDLRALVMHQYSTPWHNLSLVPKNYKSVHPRVPWKEAPFFALTLVVLHLFHWTVMSLNVFSLPLAVQVFPGTSQNTCLSVGRSGHLWPMCWEWSHQQPAVQKGGFGLVMHFLSQPGHPAFGDLWSRKWSRRTWELPSDLFLKSWYYPAEVGRSEAWTIKPLHFGIHPRLSSLSVSGFIPQHRVISAIRTQHAVSRLWSFIYQSDTGSAFMKKQHYKDSSMSPVALYTSCSSGILCLPSLLASSSTEWTRALGVDCPENLTVRYGLQQLWASPVLLLLVDLRRSSELSSGASQGRSNQESVVKMKQWVWPHRPGMCEWH